MYATIATLSLFFITASPKEQSFDALGHPTATIFNPPSFDFTSTSKDPALLDPARLIETLSISRETAGESSNSPIQYELTSKYEHFDGTYLHFAGRVDGKPVGESEIIITLSTDGAIEGVSGVFWSLDEVPPQQTSTDRIISAMRSELGPAATVDSVLHPRFGEEVVRISYEDGRLELIGVESAELVHESSGWSGNSGQGGITLNRSTFNPADPDTPSGYTSSSTDARYNTEWFDVNSFVWELSWLPNGTAHRFERVDSECCAEVTKTEPLGTTPFFSATTGSAFNQQNAYYWVKKARDYLVTTAWNAHPSTEEYSVKITVDDDAPCFQNQTGCYNYGQKTMYIQGNAARGIFTAVHEYGHYLVQSYGSLDDTCVYQVNEGRAVNEAVGDIVSWLMMTSSTVGAGYSSEINQLTRTSLARQHYDTVYSYSNRCTTPGQYAHGDPFRQAVWEVMNNLNCGTMTTCSSSTSFGDDLWQDGESRATVSARVSRAIAKALKATGKNTTFSSIVNWFVADVRASSGDAVANRVDDVFEHHGF